MRPWRIGTVTGRNLEWTAGLPAGRPGPNPAAEASALLVAASRRFGSGVARFRGWLHRCEGLVTTEGQAHNLLAHLGEQFGSRALARTDA
jgi:hypothetical protein